MANSTFANQPVACLRKLSSMDDRPSFVVVVLPGITGTVLWWKDKRIWLDLPQLAFGGLRRLAIDALDITAKEPLALYYGALCKFLATSHEVRPWGYDWRRSILDNARAFATVLNGALAGTDQPVRIVAHSMGGLVARSAFLDPKLWQRFQGRAGSRLIQLGTPNGGSWSIPYMLMGRDTMMGYLATLDLTMSRRDQQAVVARFPGALQMLPHEDATLFDAARWAALAQLDPGDEGWVLPRADDLAVAAGFRESFATAPLDPDRLLYIAGHAPTMVGIEEDAGAAAGQRISFRMSQEGDGQVPWRTGIPPGIRAWYAEAVHGDLARHQPAFPAIVDLLERGTTNLLPATPPAALRGPGALRSKVRDTVPMYPDAVDLALAGMGGTREAVAEQAAAPIRIKVVHGHLAFARHPVLVGHYAGDTINGAEAALDKALKDRLTKRKKFGLYPGALGTSTVALDRTTRPPGAIVVGLGDHADLAPGTLAETLRRGILAYAIENDDARCAQNPDQAVSPLGITALLVGAGVGGLPIASSIEALLRAAMEAQRALRDDGLREIEVMELVEDRALGERIFARIEGEWRRTGEMLALITGETTRLVGPRPLHDAAGRLDLANLEPQRTADRLDLRQIGDERVEDRRVGADLDRAADGVAARGHAHERAARGHGSARRPAACRGRGDGVARGARALRAAEAAEAIERGDPAGAAQAVKDMLTG